MTADGSDFSLAFSRALGKVIVHVRGPLVTGTAPELRDRLVDIIDGQGNRHVVLDLRATTRVDTSGLSVLGNALRRIRSRGGEMIVSGPGPEVTRALESAGLDKVILVTPAWQHPASGTRRTDLGQPGWGRSG